MEYQDHPASPTEYLPSRDDQGVIHEAEERAVDIRARLHQDMRTTVISQYAGEWLSENEGLIESLVEDAMFQIEHLLVEIEALHIKDRAKSGSLSEPVGWPRD